MVVVQLVMVYTTTWDTYDNTYEDEVLYLMEVQMPDHKPLENGVVYNV